MKSTNKKTSAAEVEADRIISEQIAKEKAMIDEVAKRHNQSKVLMIKVPLNDAYTEFAYGFIKYPERTDVSIAMTMRDTDPLRGKEIVIRNNWLEGDMKLLDDDELFLSTCTALDEVLSIRQAIVKKNYSSGL
ncbi:MAG: hypothetical protein JSR11_03620 [Bacteroidetes bacterium]|nr:hypothetical protein [Bacteroidota bacterium]